MSVHDPLLPPVWSLSANPITLLVRHLAPGVVLPNFDGYVGQRLSGGSPIERPDEDVGEHGAGVDSTTVHLS